MSSASSSDLKFEIGHVLFIDIVGYSKLLLQEQSKRIQDLREIVRGTEQFRSAEAEGKLLRLPTGDGGALVFRTTPEAPVLCALGISEALRAHPELRVRMGIHSGPVNEITDLNEQANIAGAGINIAQRVMDCGDAGHILLSKHIAEDLEHSVRWQPQLHDLGECKTKHSDVISVVNLYDDEVGNPQLPEKFKEARRERAAAAAARQTPRTFRSRHVLIAAVTLLIAFATIGFWIYSRQAPGTPPAKSIAVLPFDNQNRDPGTDYLSDGIPESIINSLSQLSQLKVMARSTVFQYKGKEVDPRKVGRNLGVGAVLMGRLIQQGDNLTIRTELVNVSDGTELWGQQYNRKLADVFAVQEEIAKEISEKLRLKLSGSEKQQLAKRPTENIQAFQYYMQGRSISQRRTREDLLSAVQYYGRAIEEDRNYALAYAGLSDAYSTLGVFGYIAPIEGRRKAEEAARKALALDESLPEAHAVLGLAYINFAPSNFSLGDGELRHAIELSPSLALAHFYLGVSLTRQGRLNESVAEYLKARELDPLSSIIARQAAIPYYFRREYSRALELLQQANDVGPAFSTTWEIGLYIQNRRLDETLAELEKVKGERKNDSILIYDTGMIYAAQGKKAQALQIIKELEDVSGANLSQALWVAKIYAVLNEKEQALAWLDRGLATGALAIFYKDEPVWDPIRSDPRFKALATKASSPKDRSVP